MFGVFDGLLQGHRFSLLPGSSECFLSQRLTGERDHVLVAMATDAVGHTAGPVEVAFTVDTTAPVITIGGVVDGATYYVDATPTFTVTDTNPGTETALLDGVPFVSGTTVSTNGAHTLTVSAVDRAGNTATRSVSFTVIVIDAALSASAMSPEVTEPNS